MRINIHTVFDEKSFDYFKFMYESTIKIARYKENIAFHAYLMGKISNNDAVIGFCDDNKIKLVNTGINKISSMGHAACLSVIFKHFIKNEINIISDSDIAICKRNFDEWILKELSQYDVIGTRYEDIGGPCVEQNYPKVGTLDQTYKERPNLIWCAFTHTHDFSNVSVSAPNTKSTCLKIETQLQSQIWGLPQGYNLWKDAGWEFPKYLHDNELKYFIFLKGNPYVGFTPQNTPLVILKGKFLEGLSYNNAIYSEEYQLLNGEPFLIHQRGSRKRAFMKDIVSRKFYEAYLQYLNKEKIN